MKIRNKGKATAKNIRLSFPEGNDSFVHPHDVKKKFPLEALETFASVELLVVSDLTTKPKQVIHLLWDDDFGSDQEKLVYLTLWVGRLLKLGFFLTSRISYRYYFVAAPAPQRVTRISPFTALAFRMVSSKLW